MESISHQIYLLINLSNSSNKQSFENLLTIWLLSAGHNVIQHTDDADWILVDRVSKLENRDVFVHADDTGILVLLINKLPTTPNHSVHLKLDKSNRTINMTLLTATISPSKIDTILLVHAMFGCVTTGIFGIGKRIFFLKAVFSTNRLNVVRFF